MIDLASKDWNSMNCIEELRFFALSQDTVGEEKLRVKTINNFCGIRAKG